MRELCKIGALRFNPPMFSPSDNSTHTVGPSDNWSAVCLVLVTNSPSSKPKVDELFVHPKNDICTLKSRTNCHNVTVRLKSLKFQTKHTVLIDEVS
jgi:hypothetical protein